MEKLDIRNAEAGDRVWVGEMLLETLYGFGTYLTGLGSSQRGAEVLRDYFNLPSNRFSYQFSFIAKQNDENAGLLVSFPGKALDRASWVTSLQMFRVYSLREVFEYLRRTNALKDEEEVKKDEYYIAHLAVDPAYRRNGIGLALLKFAEQKALENDIHKLSLMAESSNFSARALYTKFGFEVVREFVHPNQLPLTGSAGYVRMVKNI